MAEENTTVLPQIHKIAKFTYADQNDYLNQKYGDDGKITGREKRLAKKYWISDQRFKDQDAWNHEQKTQFYRSVDAFIKAAQARQALSATIAPEIPGNDNEQDPPPAPAPVPVPEPAPEPAPGSDPPPAPEAPLTPNWLKIATDNGFANLDEVKAFQKKVGLEETGQLNEASLEKLKWYNHMKGLNYSENSLTDGQVSFFNDGTIYYNNGRMQSYDGNMSNYDYKTLSAPQPVVKPRPSVTKEQFLNNEYFRSHHTAGETVTIDGKEYPIMVTQKLLNKKQYGLENDRTYALDPDTGLIRLVTENGFGMISPMGVNPTFQHGSDWVDASSLIIPSYTSVSEFKQREAEWLKNNPKPDNAFLKREWGNKYATAKRAGFKLDGGIIKKQYFKQGGTMNRIKYFQQGGPAQQQGAQDVQQQVVALVQAAMQGDEKANQTVTQIMEAAKAGDPQATQLAQLIQQVVQQMKGQATAAKWGSKLNYIRSLKYAKGGKACPECEKGALIKVEEKACGGKAKKAKKRYFGGWL